MSWTFGRIGVAAASGGDGLTLPPHYPASYDGDVMVIECDLYSTTVEDQKVLREQFRGYDLNDDAPTVMITSSQDPTIDGEYRVEAVNVDDTPGTHFTGGIGSKVTAEVSRLSGSQMALHELRCGGTARVNAHSVPVGSTIPLVGAPVGAFQATTGFDTATTLTGSDGAIPVWYDASSPSTYRVTPSWLVAAANAHKGGCRLEVSHDSGVTWRTVTGRQVRNLPTYWRISNSLVRVTATTTANKLELSVEHHDGTQWDTAKVWQVTQDTIYTALVLAPTSLTVFKVGLDEIRVQVGAGTTYRVALDVRLRRGSRVVDCHLAHPAITDLGVRRGTNEAATALSTTCGLRATADSDGNKYVVATPLALAGTDTTIGAIRVSSSTFPFGIGAAVGGTVGTGFGETMGVASAYLAGITHTERVVAF